MANDKVEITAGSGTNVDVEIEAGGDARQNICIADKTTTAGVAPVDGTAGLKVNLGSDNDVTNGGTFATQATLQAGTAEVGKLAAGVAEIGNVKNSGAFAVQSTLQTGSAAIGKLAANDGVDIGDVDVASVAGLTMSNAAAQTTGDEANDAIDAGNPIKIGFKAQDPWAQPEEVADNDRVNALADENGYQRVRGDLDPKSAIINDNTSGDNEIIAAVATKRIAIWSVIAISDGTTDVRFEDGAGGTAFTGQMPLQAREGFTYSAGGLIPLWVGAVNTAFSMELTAAVFVHGSVTYSVMDD